MVFAKKETKNEILLMVVCSPATTVHNGKIMAKSESNEKTEQNKNEFKSYQMLNFNVGVELNNFRFLVRIWYRNR